MNAAEQKLLRRLKIPESYAAESKQRILEIAKKHTVKLIDIKNAVTHAHAKAYVDQYNIFT